MCPLVDASSKMNVLLLLVTAGFTVCEKLDRTYLPPPGSKFSGGSPGDIQTPLEFPKEYPSRLTQTANNGLPTLDDPRIELGINRGLEIATVSTTPFPVTHFQTSSRVPSTTTSYAFSQTSIFPVDSYETTTAAVISNFPTTRPVNDFREHLVSKHPQSSNNPQYQQGFGQSLIKSQIAQPRFRTTDSPIYSAQLATKNNSFYSGLNDQKYNQQQTMPSGHETNPSSPNTFELFKNRYNSENVHDPSRIHYPSNSYLPVKQNKQVYNVEKQYQQYYRRPISRYPAAQIASDKQKEGAAHLFEETNTPILAPEFSEQSTIPTSNYVTNLSSTPSKDYPTSVYQELPHQTSLSGIRKIVSSSLPDIYSDSSSRTGFPKTQAKENLNQLNTNENNFLTTEISQKPLSYNYTQKTSNRFSHPGYYSTTAAPVSPVQFTGDYPSAILNNQIPSIYSSEVVPGSVNKPLIYKTKSTPSPFQPLITSTYSGNKGILTPAPVLESTNIAFENTPTDVSIGTQSPSKLLHTTNQAYSTTSASGVTNIPSNIGDSAKESQSVFVPKADNTQYAIKSLAQPSYSTAHKKDHPDSPQMESDRNAVILNYENVINPDGFKYSYDTSNGIHAEETGTANDGVKATGGFSYTGDDGKVYTITYSADENGFRPSGDHLPTPPPIPEAILRMLEQNTKDEEAGIFDDGSYNEDKYGHKKYQGTNDYDIWQPVYSRPSINIPQPTKQELDRINKENSNTVNLTKLHEHNIEDYVDEEDQTEHGIPINFVPSKHVHSNNESIKNGTFIRKIGKPITAEINYSDIIGHSEILLDSKDSTSSDLHKYLPTPSDILKDDSKSSVTSQRLDQRKPIDKTLENIKNIPEPIMELDLTNGNQYIGTHKNNGFKPTKGESKNNYETNYVQRNRGPMVNSNKGIPKFTTDQTYQEITNKPLGRGYVYNPPQNKNFPAPNEFQMQSSAGEVISTIRPFSSRQETAINESNRKPFMTPNVSREDVYDKYYNNSSPYENKSESVHPESQFLENVDHDSGSEVTDSETLTSTSRHPEYDTTPNFKTFTPYQKEGNRYAENKFTHSTTQEPGENSSLKTSTPLRDSVKFESTSSPEDTDVSQISQYPATFRPIKGSRITGYPSSTDSTIIANTFNSAPQKLTHDNVPSTTFRPNYTIFQENRPEGLNVDIYGRPIDTESYDEGPIETRPKHGKNFQTGSLPGKGLVADSDFYPSDKAEYNEQIRQEGLNVGKDVQAPSYPSSFDKVKGENFSGTTRNQKFDPQIGYYYK